MRLRDSRRSVSGNRSSALTGIQKSSADGPSNPIAKTFHAVFSAFGKLLGF